MTEKNFIELIFTSFSQIYIPCCLFFTLHHKSPLFLPCLKMLTVKALRCVTNAFLIGLLKISQNTKLQARGRRYTNGDKMGTFLPFITVAYSGGFPLIPRSLYESFSDALRLSNDSQPDKNFICPFTVS